jgi:hypothetical protein
MSVRTGVFQSRIDNAIRVLDAFYGPEWPFRVNTRKLDLAIGECCVLGQLANGSYIDGRSKIAPLQVTLPELGYRSSQATLQSVFAEALGFETQKTSQYPALTRAWKTTIVRLKRERRSLKPVQA